jgi:hypothetical protein
MTADGADDGSAARSCQRAWASEHYSPAGRFLTLRSTPFRGGAPPWTSRTLLRGGHTAGTTSRDRGRSDHGRAARSDPERRDSGQRRLQTVFQLSRRVRRTSRERFTHGRGVRRVSLGTVSLTGSLPIECFNSLIPDTEASETISALYATASGNRHPLGPSPNLWLRGHATAGTHCCGTGRSGSGRPAEVAASSRGVR